MLGYNAACSYLQKNISKTNTDAKDGTMLSKSGHISILSVTISFMVVLSFFVLLLS